MQIGTGPTLGASNLLAASGLEMKFLEMPDAPSLAEDGRIEGRASLFGVSDRGGDVVAKGAFANSLAALKQSGRSVKFLWQHDPTEVIGVWDQVAEDDAGLVVRGRLLTETRRGAEALALLQAGAIDGLSIGYRAVAASPRPDGGRLLTEIDLWEVSVVTFPMLADARVSAFANSYSANVNQGNDQASKTQTISRDPLEDITRSLAEAFSDARGRLRA